VKGLREALAGLLAAQAKCIGCDRRATRRNKLGLLTSCENHGAYDIGEDVRDKAVADAIEAAERELAATPPTITITKTEPDTWSIRGAGLATGCNDLEVEDYEAMATALGATVVFDDLSEPGPCAHCGKPAACVGCYESPTNPVQRACDECCQHGNEDGWCKQYGGGDYE
jgi:hypothetical protein